MVINDKTVENERNNFHGYGCSAVINAKTVENERENVMDLHLLNVLFADAWCKLRAVLGTPSGSDRTAPGEADLLAGRPRPDTYQ